MKTPLITSDPDTVFSLVIPVIGLTSYSPDDSSSVSNVRNNNNPP